MHRSRLQDREPFTTLDGSTIREVAHPAWTAARHQSLAEATVPPHGATEAHLHRVTEELYFFTAGRGRMRLGDDEFDVAAGDCVVIPPGTEHALVNTGRRAARAPVLLRARLLPTRTPSSRAPRRSRAPGAAPTPRRDAPVPHDARGPGRRAGGRARPRRPRPPRRRRSRRRPPPPVRGVLQVGLSEQNDTVFRDPTFRRLGLRYARLVVAVGPRAGPRPPAHRGPSLGRPRRDQRDRAARRVRRDVVLAPQPQPRPVAVALPDRGRALPPAVPERPRLHPVERGQPLPAADGRAAGAGRALLRGAQVGLRLVPRPRRRRPRPAGPGPVDGRLPPRPARPLAAPVGAAQLPGRQPPRPGRAQLDAALPEARPRPDLGHGDGRHRAVRDRPRPPDVPLQPARGPRARCATSSTSCTGPRCAPATRASTSTTGTAWRGGSAASAGTPGSSAPTGARAPRSRSCGARCAARAPPSAPSSRAGPRRARRRSQARRAR